MDYQVFLVTRMREEYVHGARPTQAVVAGFGHGARVVTAAALIMISVFAGVHPRGDAIIKSIGFALAVGVLFDAFVVRMTIIPAVMALLGRGRGGSPWLDRILPNVDVEGREAPAAPRRATPRAKTSANSSERPSNRCLKGTGPTPGPVPSGTR